MFAFGYKVNEYFKNITIMLPDKKKTLKNIVLLHNFCLVVWALPEKGISL